MTVVDAHSETAQDQSGSSRTVLVTFLGAIVRRMGNWTPISATVDLMAQVGVDAGSVRTSVFRLKKRGWLEAESRGGRRGYGLTPTALEAFAAGDQVIWHARQPARLSEGWCVVVFSVPERERTQRHQLRSSLSALGFGNAGAGVWIAPARMREAAERSIAQLHLTSYCAIFVGNYVGGQDLAAMLRESWDLDEINGRYCQFIEQFDPVVSQLGDASVIEPRDAFVTYVDIIDHWRKLPVRDPGLPPELLVRDWAAPAAATIFEDAVRSLEGRALAHAASYWGP